MSDYIYIVNCEDDNGEDTWCIGGFKTHQSAVDYAIKKRYGKKEEWDDERWSKIELQREKLAKSNFLRNNAGGFTIKKVKLRE